MSSTDTLEVETIADEAHDEVPPSETGGSQSSGDDLAVDDDGLETAEEVPAETVEEGGDEGQKPAAKPTKDSAGASPDADRVREIETENAQHREDLAYLARLARTDPSEAIRLLNPGATQDGAPKGLSAEIEAAIAHPEDGLDKASAKAMRGIVAPLVRKIEFLERELGRAGSTVGKIAQTTAQREFQQGLRDAKVPVDNPAFQRILKELRRDPDFVEAERLGKPIALRTAKAEWFAQAGRSATARDDGARLQAAKSGRTGKPGGGNAALAERIVKFTDGFDAGRHFKLLTDAAKAGKPAPKIEYAEK